MFLLTPKEGHVSLLKGVIGRALELFDFEIFGYAYLSNHGSLLVGVHSPSELSQIMEEDGLGLGRGRPHQR